MTEPATVPRIQEAQAASTDELLDRFEPEVRDWFTNRFDAFTPPQRYALNELAQGHNVLISSPTGTGKTLSAFLAAINQLVQETKQGTLEDRVHVLYVSPLKALNNDIERNLETPLGEIRERLEEADLDPDAIRVGVRTGDTSKYERQKMTQTPPHILITTPESLGILLNAPTFSEHLTDLDWIIVDEVHALAENKRGTHLSLSLERLCARIRRESPHEPPDQGLHPAEPTRIGLSATIHPLDTIARFLVGHDTDGNPRPCRVVDVTYESELTIDVLAPHEDLITTPENELTNALYTELDTLIDDHDTTLIFTNTRAGTERVVHRLTDAYDRDEDTIGAHHGSMAKDNRLDVEQRLRENDLDAVVTSTSLELGIDIGSIDLVLLLSSPRGVARALQRIGRSGHGLGEESKGQLVALDRDDLIECTVIAHEARQGDLDPIEIPPGGLDVLCQHLVGMALARIWPVDDAFEVIRRADPYHALSREDYENCLTYLSSNALEDQRVYPKIWWDTDEATFGRRGTKTRPIYYTNIGTIPDTTQLTVKDGDTVVGTIDEEFVESLSKGDVFTLGGTTWEYRGASPVKARVDQATSRRPTVPRWISETLPLRFEMTQRVAQFRYNIAETLATQGPKHATHQLIDTYQLDAADATTIVDYIQDQHRYASVPDPQGALVEEHTNQNGQTRLVFHTPIGRRGCQALARAFTHRIEQTKNIDAAWRVNDYGFVLTLPPNRKLTTDEIRGLFLIDLERALYEAVDDAELLRRRFRYVAARALMILRNYLGTNISVGRQNAAARQLLRRLQREIPDSPVLEETYRELLTDALDVPHVQDYLFRFVSRQARVHVERNLPGPSPFAFNLVAASTPNAVLAEDRRDAIERFHRTVQTALETPSRAPR